MKVVKPGYLDYWPGYAITPEVYISGLYFNIDAVSKFIQSKSVLEILYEMLEKKKMPEDKIKDIILKRERRVPGFTVITKWGK